MKVALSTPGRFHTFDLARQLLARDYLSQVFTAFPYGKVAHEGIPRSMLRCFPWLQGPLMAYRRLNRSWKDLEKEWEWWAKVSFDAHVARHLGPCDAFVALSSVGLTSSRTAKRYGALYVCDRGSSHIRYQDRIVREEHERFGVKEFVGVDPRIGSREEQEYEKADLITVPSTFALGSFVEAGVPESKLRVVPYGVELTRFARTGKPAADTFQVLFVGSVTLRKGVPYLLEAFLKLNHPEKRLLLVGACSEEMRSFVRDRCPGKEVRVVGPVAQAKIQELMNSSQVMVLPSVEEGLALVLGQAIACGCPVIASANTGASDLITDGCEGYIVPIRDPDAISDRLQHLADHPEVRQQMSDAALSRVARLGGWNEYGANYVAVLEGSRSS